MQFTYRAKKDVRTEASGVVEALDLSAAVSHLRGIGLYPLEVVPLETAAGRAIQKAQNSKRSLSRKALALWARMLGQGLGSGLTLTQALRLLAEQEKGRPLGGVAGNLEENVLGGMNLADAMEHVAGCFSPMAIGLVRAGESSGSLDKILHSLSAQVEAEEELVAKVQGALVYPLFVLTVGFGTVAVLVWVVVPKLALLFAETGQPLPWTTRLMIESGRGLMWGVAGIFLSAGVLLFGVRRLGWKLPFSAWARGFTARLPVFGPLMRQAELARLSATLGLLLSHGVTLPAALRLAADTLSPSELKVQIGQTVRDVVEGLSLTIGLQRAGVHEPFLLTLGAMGEVQGDMARVFHQAGERYHQEVDRSIKILSTLVEPVMILLVGLVVGVVVFSMLMPVFQINLAG